MSQYHEGCRHEEAQVFRVTGGGKADKYKRLCLLCWDNMHGPGQVVPKSQLPPVEERPCLQVLKLVSRGL